MTDDEILDMIQNEQKLNEGFSHLMRKYKVPLYHNIRRMLIYHQDTDDVLQNVFIRIYRNIGRFRREAQLNTWMYKIAINECKSFLNAKQRQSTGPLQDAHINEQITSDEPHINEQLKEKLQVAIQTLPDRQQEVFCLRYYEELPYDKIADILDLSVGSLKASYYHAVKKIEHYFNEINKMTK